MKKIYKTIVCFFIVGFFCILCSMQVRASDYGFGKYLLNWEDTIFVGNADHIYAIEKGKTPWTHIASDASGRDFFAEEDMVFFVCEDEDGTFLCYYDMESGDAYAAGETEAGADLIGKNGDNLYYLEQDKTKEYYEGRTLKSFDLTTGKTRKIAEGIGTARYWNGVIIMAEMASDVSPVSIYMLDKNEKLALVDQYCAPDFWANEDGFYYLRCEMTDDIAWDGQTLCSIDNEGRKEFAFFGGEYQYVSTICVYNGFYYGSMQENGKTVSKSVKLETCQTFNFSSPVSGITPEFFKDGFDGYWLCDGKLYNWGATGYVKVASLGSDETLLGVADDNVYYTSGTEKELMMMPLK